MRAADLVQKFSLVAHPEGGFFAESYRSNMEVIDSKVASTGIYFLLPEGHQSHFHRIKSDEMWHFYLGGPLMVVEITPDGKLIETTLGQDVMNGERLQYVVKAGHWFGSYPKPGVEFSLVGCTVAPGFEFSDFEMAKKAELLRQYPQHKTIVEKLSKD